MTPVASFTVTPTSGTVPLTTTFTDTSTNIPTSWSWDFGDGGTSTSQNPSYIYAAVGTYTVTLTATNASGSNVSTQAGLISVLNSNTTSYQSWDGGTGAADGVAVSTSNTGGTGNTSVTNVTTSGGGALTFVTAQAYSKPLSIKFNQPSGSLAYVVEPITTTIGVRFVQRLLLYIATTSTTSSWSISNIYTSGNTQVSGLYYTTSGTLGFGPSGAVDSGFTMPLNQWVAVELGVTIGATAGAGLIDLTIYSNPANTVPDYYSGSVSNTGLGTTVATTARIGGGTATVSFARVWYHDNWIFKNYLLTGHIGPPMTPAGIIYKGNALGEIASGTSITLTYPTGISIGDVVVAVAGNYSSNAVPTPTGWTLVSTNGGAGTPSGESATIFYRVINGTEGASLTVAGYVTGKNTLELLDFSGVNTTSVIDVSAQTLAETTSSSTVPTITTVTNGAVILYATVVQSTTATVTPPLQATLAVDSTGTGRRTTTALELQPTAGALGTRTIAYSSSLYHSIIVFALSPSVALPYTETWTGSNGAAWPATWATSQSAGSGGSATIVGNAGRLTAGTTGTSFMKAYLGAIPVLADTDSIVSFTIGAQMAGFFNIQFNADNTQYSSNPGEMPQNGYTVNFTTSSTATSGSFDIWKMVANGATQIYTTTTLTLTSGTKYTVRFRRTGTAIKFRIWAASASEPQSWTASYTDTGTMLPANRVALSVGNNGTSGQYVDFDDFTVMVPSSTVKAWTGSAQAIKPLKVWNGSAWVLKPLKVWNGSAWVVSSGGS